MLLLQAVPLLVSPVYLLVLGGGYFLSSFWVVPIWCVAGAWVVFIYVVTTWLAVQRLAQAEERILQMMAGRGAS
jgi:hypothetical protein